MLKCPSFYTSLMIFMIAAAFANGDVLPEAKDGTLRIIYSGNLLGNIEPCG